MASKAILKPENILTRAEKLLSVNKRADAMKVLHDYVTRPQFCMMWVPKLHDEIIKRDLELCVESRNSANIKDALFQLKTATRSSSFLSSFEGAVSHLFSLLDNDVQNAYQKVENLISSGSSKGAGLADSGKMPQDLKDLKAEFIMSSVSADEEKERVLSASVIPHFRFFGEVIHSVLDVCRSNTRLLGIYEEATRRLFAFCRKYRRVEEFRVVSSSLRLHLNTLIDPSPDHANRQYALDLSFRDTVETLLRIRFDQLKTAMELEHFSDAYNILSIEMRRLLNAARVMPDPRNSVQYYEGLAELFWISRNRLIHARCLHAMLGLLIQMPAVISELRKSEEFAEESAVANNEEYKKPTKTAADMQLPTPDELQQAATKCVLAALCAPVVKTKTDDAYNPAVLNDKNRRISKNLGFAVFMTREAILSSLAKDALPLAADFARQLYDLLEGSQTSEDVCANVAKICDWILAPENGQPESIKRYVPFFKTLAFLRLLQFCSKENRSLSYSDVLAKTGNKSWIFDIQPTVLEFSRNGLVAVTLDPVGQMVLFPRPANEAVAEMPLLLKKLGKLALVIDPSLAGRIPSAEVRQARIEMIRNCSDKEQQQFAERRKMQEEKAARRQAYDKYLKEREEEAARRRREEEEAAERQRQAKKREEEELAKKKLEEQKPAAPAKPVNAWANLSASVLSADGVVGGTVLADGQSTMVLSGSASLKQRQALEADARAKAEKAKQLKAAKELEDKVTKMEEDAQYFERAKRREEPEALRAKVRKDNEKKKKEYDEANAAEDEKLKKEFERLIVIRKKLDPIRGDRDEFMKLIMTIRQADLAKRMEEYNAKVEVAKKKWEEEQRKIREEREAREAKERKEREERAAREAQERKEREEREAREAKERKEREEKAAREAQERRERLEKEEREAEERNRKAREEREKKLMEEQRKAAAESGKYVLPSSVRQDDDEGWSRVGSNGRVISGGRDRDNGAYRPPARDRDSGRDRDSDAYRPPARDRDSGRDRDSDAYRPPARDRDSGRDRDRDAYRPPARDRDSGRDRDSDAYRPPARDRGYGDRDRDRGYGDRDRDRGYGDRDRDRGYGDRDRDRGYGDRDRDRGYGDRDRDRGYGDRDRDRGYGDRDRDRGYGDRDRDRGYGDRDRDRGYSDRDRDRDAYRPPARDRDSRDSGSSSGAYRPPGRR